jgi:molecular chaperone DnaJ
VLVAKKVSVKIPAGVDNGSRLRLTNEGEPGAHGGPPGDLYVFIYVEAHDFFERRESDIICQIPISFIQATLGDNISVPTLNGNKQLKIPKGTQPGEVLAFHGEGIASLRTGKRGDQLMQIDIKTPTHLNRRQEALLKEFAKLESNKLSKKLKNILKGGVSQATN